MHVPQSTKVTEAAEVAAWLTEHNLTNSAFVRALQYASQVRSNCTDNDAPNFAGTLLWGYTLRVLADQLAPLGWVRKNDNQLPRIVSPDGKMEILVATGNNCTGYKDYMPQAKRPRGEATIRAVERTLFDPIDVIIEPEPVPDTWIFLFHPKPDKIRFELSLPASIGIGGRVTSWVTRVIFNPIEPGGSEATPEVEDVHHDVDVSPRSA